MTNRLRSARAEWERQEALPAPSRTRGDVVRALTAAAQTWVFSCALLLGGSSERIGMMLSVVVAFMIACFAATLGGTASMGGVGLPMGLSFGLSLFVFGLYEAGTVVEQPLKEAIDLVPLEASGFELSDDLSNLVDDPDSSVPVFLSPKAVKRV